MLNIIKILISAILIVCASEIAKRSSFWGALIIVMPINSILSLCVYYFDTKDSARTADYAKEIFTLVPLSLVFFIPFLLAHKTGWSFGINILAGFILLGLALALTILLKKAN